MWNNFIWLAWQKGSNKLILKIQDQNQGFTSENFTLTCIVEENICKIVQN